MSCLLQLNEFCLKDRSPTRWEKRNVEILRLGLILKWLLTSGYGAACFYSCVCELLLEGTQSFLEYKYQVQLSPGTQTPQYPLTSLFCPPVSIIGFLDQKTVKNKDFSLILKEHHQASWALSSRASSPSLRLSRCTVLRGAWLTE